MRKLILPVVIALSLAACGDDKKEGEDDAKETKKSGFDKDAICDCIQAENMGEISADCEEMSKNLMTEFKTMTDEEKQEFQDIVTACQEEFGVYEDSDDSGMETFSKVTSPEEFERECINVMNGTLSRETLPDMTDEQLAQMRNVVSSYCTCTKDAMVESGYDFSSGEEMTEEQVMEYSESCREEMMEMLMGMSMDDSGNQ